MYKKNLKSNRQKDLNHQVIWEVWFELSAEIDGFQVFPVQGVTDEWYPNFHNMTRNNKFRWAGEMVQSIECMRT